MTPCPFGFRVLDGKAEERRLVDWAAAFRGYAGVDERADVHREAYLSAFCYGEDFRDYLELHRTTKGFGGVCWSPWLWFDVDRADALQLAVEDARRLVGAILHRYAVADDDVLVFVSGGKGFHVGIPTALWMPPPSVTFNGAARRFAEHVAGLAGVDIDTGVYDKVRLFRAPNSRHPKTGLFKRRLSVDELLHLSVDAIVKLAEHPEPFEIPTPRHCCELAGADWRDSVAAVERQAEAKVERRAADNGSATLNRRTFAFIRDGAALGDRHRLLFSAAANLAEFGCPPALAHALLTDAGLDCGLSPSDVRRQIDCGLDAVPSGPDSPEVQS